VIAPSESLAEVLREQGVTSPIEVIPTGIDRERFGKGEGAAFRASRNIPAGAFVVGHVGRLAPEKNLEFLTRAVARFLTARPTAHFLLVGAGPSLDPIREISEIMADGNVENRFHAEGAMQMPELVDAYHAMDVFAFASQSETQGMVLTEAMASGLPVVAVDAMGVREVVRDKKNGRLMQHEDEHEFASALEWIAKAPPARRQKLRIAARDTAEAFSMPRCAERLVALYGRLASEKRRGGEIEDSFWQTAVRRFAEEWKIWANVSQAAGHALSEASLVDATER
jgi:glycosyltransferase involved in cell wall biosynthesis